MKITAKQKRIAAVVLIFLAIVTLIIVFKPAKASDKCSWGYCQPGPPGPQGPPGMDGKDYLHDDSAWSDHDLDNMFAASTAMAGIDFDSTTSKLQLGTAFGGYGGEIQGAIGIGKVLDNKKFGDILVSFKTTFDEVGRSGDEKRPWVASATWKIKLE